MSFKLVLKGANKQFYFTTDQMQLLSFDTAYYSPCRPKKKWRGQTHKIFDLHLITLPLPNQIPSFAVSWKPIPFQNYMSLRLVYVLFTKLTDGIIMHTEVLVKGTQYTRDKLASTLSKNVLTKYRFSSFQACSQWHWLKSSLYLLLPKQLTSLRMETY